MSESNDKQKDKGMDPATVSALVVLASNIASLAIKYNDPALKAPSAEAVLARLEEFQKLQPLPEEYDVGFVDEIMGRVKSWIIRE